MVKTDEPGSLGVGHLRPGQGKREKSLSFLKHLGRGTGIRRQSRSTKGGGGKRVAHRISHTYGRRTIVKVSYRRNRHNGNWRRHARYLTRKGSQLDHEPGIAFDRDHDQVDMVQTATGWQSGSDKLIWSMIVAPDDLAQLDHRQHIRDLVNGMERDLGTKLEWVAVDHRNTDNDHVHLLIRGVREDGRELMLDRDYIQTGIRELDQHLIEKELGPRSEHEMLADRDRGLTANYMTDIDFTLKRRQDADHVISYDNWQPFNEESQTRVRQEIRRLEHLETLGLADRIGESTWQLSPDHETTLRQMQRDMNKQRRWDLELDIDRA